MQQPEGADGNIKTGIRKRQMFRIAVLEPDVWIIFASRNDHAVRKIDPHGAGTSCARGTRQMPGACADVEEVALRHASNVAPERLLALNRALQQIRGELARTLMARRAEDSRKLDAILYTNHEVSTTMLSHSGGDAPGLTWLRHVDAPWGVLGLWADPARPAELALASCYLRDGGAHGLRAFSPGHFARVRIVEVEGYELVGARA